MIVSEGRGGQEAYGKKTSGNRLALAGISSL